MVPIAEGEGVVAGLFPSIEDKGECGVRGERLLVGVEHVEESNKVVFVLGGEFWGEHEFGSVVESW